MCKTSFETPKEQIRHGVVPKGILLPKLKIKRILKQNRRQPEFVEAASPHGHQPANIGWSSIFVTITIIMVTILVFIIIMSHDVLNYLHGAISNLGQHFGQGSDHWELHMKFLLKLKKLFLSNSNSKSQFWECPNWKEQIPCFKSVEKKRKRKNTHAGFMKVEIRAFTKFLHMLVSERVYILMLTNVNVIIPRVDQHEQLFTGMFLGIFA